TLRDQLAQMEKAEAEARKQLSEAQAAVTAHPEEILAANKKAADLEAKQDGLQKDLSNCQATINELQSKLEAVQQEARQPAPSAASSLPNEPKATTQPAPQSLVQTAEQASVIPDRDGDGIADALDLCPDTPAGAEVNELGCPPSKGLILEGVQFKSGTAELESSAIIKLDQVAASLVARPQVKVEVVGYTDSVGNSERNQQLSVRRAQAVVNYLASKDVARKQLSAKGYGQQNPIADNATAEGRSRNRRVELHPAK
ncbi:MAG: OmpA family protein, partial [Desulfobulbus sp.]|nr:OmpA family protein [Desulfobulbus sp.]